MVNAGEWRTPDEMFWYPLAPRQTPRVPPTSGIFDSPTRCIAINVEWWSHVSGVIDLLSDPDAWTGTDEEKALAEYQINRLLGEENCMLTDIRVVDCVLEKLEDGVWVEVADLSACGGSGGGGGSVVPHILEKELGAVRTTTSTTEVFVTGSEHAFTPTKENMLVRYMNICANNSGANSTEVGVRFNAVAGSSPKNARTFQSGFAFLQSSAIFEGMEVGVAHDLSLYWKVTGGTGTMSNVTKLIIEIWEYDDISELDFVENIRIQGRELQQQKNGAWETVDESLATYLNDIETVSNNALTIANTATTVNNNQNTAITAIQALNTTQNTRLDGIDASIEDIELSIGGLQGQITVLDGRMDGAEGRLEGLDFGGVWAWQHDFTTSSYYTASSGTYSAGIGWHSPTAGTLNLTYGAEQIEQNQITHIEVQFVRSLSSTVECSLDNGATWQLCESAGAGVPCSTWFRVPNTVSGDFFNIRLRTSAGVVTLTGLRYLGRGTDVPFA